jgi:phage shock protein A
MDQLTAKLMKMKERIEEDKTEKAKAEGRLQSYKAQRKQDFGCSTEKEAHEKAQEIERRIIEKENLLSDGMESLEANYVWD